MASLVSKLKLSRARCVASGISSAFHQVSLESGISGSPIFRRCARTRGFCISSSEYNPYTDPVVVGFSQEDMTSEGRLWEVFQKWKEENGRDYRSAEEEASRFEIFLRTVRSIDEVNRQRRTYWCGLNHFADMTFNEKMQCCCLGVGRLGTFLFFKGGIYDDMYETPVKKVENDQEKFKWTNNMSEFMIKKLVDQVKLGNKHQKGFKCKAYTSVAQEVTRKFGKQCFANNVENHFKTLGRNWEEVMNLRSLSEHVFDDASKTIKLDEATAKDYIKRHPRAKAFLNQPIRMYEELSLIFGNPWTKQAEEPPHVEENSHTHSSNTRSAATNIVEDNVLGEAKSSKANEDNASKANCGERLSACNIKCKSKGQAVRDGQETVAI